jgi:hypothetical protein
VIPGLGDRMKGARMATGVKLNRTVSQGLMAQLVTAELARLGSDKTISQPQWSDYESEKGEPSTIVYRATANVSGTDERFIAFGDVVANALPNPELDRGLTLEEAERAIAAAAKKRAAKKHQKRGGASA